MANYSTAGMQGYGASWEHKGHFGQGNIAPLLNSLAGKPALVVGSGRGVFENFDRVYDRSQVVFAANDVGVYLPVVNHLVSLHASKLAHWSGLRRDESSRPVGNTDISTHTTDGGEADYCWQNLEPLMPLSGYFAMQIAWLMGAGSITLIGCPGDNTPRFWETRPTNPAYHEDGVVRMLRNEMLRLPEFKTIVRSTDGWTADFFGRV